MDNIDTKCMSLEESKWLINRIDTGYKGNVEELRTMASRYNEMGTSEVKRLRGRRNNVLSALGVGLTVLLGIHSIEKIEEELFYFILILIFSTGVACFIFFNMLTIKTQNFFTKLQTSILKSEMNINLARGFFTGITSNSQFLTYVQLLNWGLMNRSLIASMQIPILEVLLSDKGWFLNSRLKITEQEVKTIIENVGDFKESEFQKEDYIPEQIIKFIDDSLKSFKKL